MKGLIIFDFNRTLYEPENKATFRGVREFLDDYSKVYTLALIGKGDEKRKFLIEKLDIEKYFMNLILTEEKEACDFLKCLKELNYSKEKTWSVGDRIKKEILISNKLGLKTIWFRNGKFSSEIPIRSEEYPNFTVESFQDIRKIIPL